MDIRSHSERFYDFLALMSHDCQWFGLFCNGLCGSYGPVWSSMVQCGPVWSSVVAAIPHVMATDNNLHIDDCQIEATADC